MFLVGESLVSVEHPIRGYSHPYMVRSLEDRAWPAVDVLISPWQKTSEVKHQSRR